MRAKLLVFLGLVAVLLGPTQGLTQFPGGGRPPGGPGPGGGPGGFGGGRSSFGGGGDPTAFFNTLSGGKEVLVRSEMDPRMQAMFDRIAERVGNTSGRITRDQYMAYTQQRQTERGGLAFGMATAPGLSRSDASGPGGFNPDAMAEMMFRRLDQNGDGLLNYDEMPEALRAERDKWDTNRDGFIDLTEFRAYMDARRQQMMTDRGGTSEQFWQGGAGSLADPRPVVQEHQRPTVYRTGKLPKDLPAWFTQLDTDQDAQVALYEWKASGRSIDEFQQMDRNADGFITVEEVLRVVAQGKTTPSPDANGGRSGFPGGPGTMMLGDDPGRGGFRMRGMGDNSDPRTMFRERGGPGAGFEGRDRGPRGRGPGSDGRGPGSDGRGPGPEGRGRSRGSDR